MGTFERIRKTSPYVLAIFAIVFIGFMVASDANIGGLIKGGNNYQTAVLASINGQDILYKDYEEKVKDLFERQRENASQQDQPQQVDDKQIRQQLWGQMVRDLLLGQQAEKAGITVTRDEVLDIMIDNPPDNLKRMFTDSTGAFNKATYLTFITNPEKLVRNDLAKEERAKYIQEIRQYLLDVEKSTRDQILNDKMMTLVNTAGTFISPSFAKQKYMDENTSSAVNFIFLDANRIPDNSVKVSDDEIQKYYDSHKQYYPQKPVRKMKYVVFPMVPSDRDTIAANKAVKNIVEALQSGTTPDQKDTIFTRKMRDFNGETHDFVNVVDLDKKLEPYLSTMTEHEITGPVSLPDGIYFIRLDAKRSGTNISVKASHILINFGDNKDSAKKEAERILAEAKTGDFAALATKYSQDKGSAANGGDLGYFTKGKMVKPFEEAAFAASVGSVVGPVESQFGYHIIKVTDKKSDEIKYSLIKVTPSISRMTTKAIARNADEIRRRVEAGESIESAAKFFNKPVKETQYFEKNRPVLGSNYLAAKAFEIKLGKVIDPIEIKNMGYVVAQVTDAVDEGTTPLKMVKDMIKARLIKIKKLDAIKSMASDAYNKVKNLDSLTKATTIDPSLQVKSAANVTNVGFVPGVGQDAVFSGKASTLPIGKISEPIRGELGYYIMQVTNRTSPQDAVVKNAIKEYINSLITNARGNTYYEWFSKVAEDANIEDHRAEHYKEY